MWLIVMSRFVKTSSMGIRVSGYLTFLNELRNILMSDQLLRFVDLPNVECAARTGSTLNSRIIRAKVRRIVLTWIAAVDMDDAASHADGLSGTIKSHRVGLIPHFSSLL